MNKVRPRRKAEAMLPEYGFSGGVRGKYASRFAKDTIMVVNLGATDRSDVTGLRALADPNCAIMQAGMRIVRGNNGQRVYGSV
jgi:hypothetical protein